MCRPLAAAVPDLPLSFLHATHYLYTSTMVFTRALRWISQPSEDGVLAATSIFSRLGPRSLEDGEIAE